MTTASRVTTTATVGRHLRAMTIATVGRRRRAMTTGATTSRAAGTPMSTTATVVRRRRAMSASAIIRRRGRSMSAARRRHGTMIVAHRHADTTSAAAATALARLRILRTMDRSCAPSWPRCSRGRQRSRLRTHEVGSDAWVGSEPMSFSSFWSRDIPESSDGDG